MRARAWVDARLIKSLVGDDHPYPFSPAMFEVGYGLFEPLPDHPDQPPLWPLATSDDPVKRAEFLRITELFEGTNPLNPTITDLALTIFSGSKNPVGPIQLVGNGVQEGKDSFAVLSGERHVIAMLWLWCKGVRKLPIIEVQVLGQEE